MLFRSKVYEAEMAIRDGERKLLSFFDMRTAKRPLSGGNGEKTSPAPENFNVPCGQLWTAIKDTLKNAQQYDTIGIYDSDMMAVFAAGRGDKSQRRMNQVFLKSNVAAALSILCKRCRPPWGERIIGMRPI